VVDGGLEIGVTLDTALIHAQQVVRKKINTDRVVKFKLKVVLKISQEGMSC